MWGSAGTTRRRRLIGAEFVVGAAGCTILAVLALLASGGWEVAVGVWLVGAGANDPPLAVHAHSLSGSGALEAELENLDLVREFRRAGSDHVDCRPICGDDCRDRRRAQLHRSVRRRLSPARIAAAADEINPVFLNTPIVLAHRACGLRGVGQSGSGAHAVEENLSDPGGLFQCGEVSSVRKRDRLGASK
jgi:hypothetical protein